GTVSPRWFDSFEDRSEARAGPAVEHINANGRRSRPRRAGGWDWWRVGWRDLGGRPTDAEGDRDVALAQGREPGRVGECRRLARRNVRMGASRFRRDRVHGSQWSRHGEGWRGTHAAWAPSA